MKINTVKHVAGGVVIAFGAAELSHAVPIYDYGEPPHLYHLIEGTATSTADVMKAGGTLKVIAEAYRHQR